MKLKFAAACIAAGLGLFLLLQNATAKDYTLRANSKKFYVVDGDSVNYGRLKFRLCGINAPERGRAHYQESGRMLKQLLGRGKITAHVVDIDKYKRKVAVMYAGGGSVSVNETMVRLGGAWHFRRFSQTCAAHVSPAKFNAAENAAKKRKLGIWRR